MEVGLHFCCSLGCCFFFLQPFFRAELSVSRVAYSGMLIGSSCNPWSAKGLHILYTCWLDPKLGIFHAGTSGSVLMSFPDGRLSAKLNLTDSFMLLGFCDSQYR